MPGGQFNLAQTGNARIFFQDGGAGPANVLELLQLARVTGFSWPQGDLTQVEVPDLEQYNRFLTVDTIQGQQGLPSVTLEGLYTLALSTRLQEVRRGCPVDLRAHFGNCSNAADPLDGWADGKIFVIETARPTSYDLPELGALGSDQRSQILESIQYTGLNAYEIAPITPGEFGATEITDEIIAVAICDSVQCGDCGPPSDGCQVAFAVVGSQSGSPGLPAELLYTEDGWDTVGETNILSLGLAENPSDMTCVGPNVVVVSNDSQSLHHAPADDIIEGTETWTEMTSGFVAAGAPNAIWSQSRTLTWIVGDAGYIYFSQDVTSSVEVQSAGAQTSENLLDVHTFDGRNILAVGANNAVVFSANGGASWSLITGPRAGVTLNACWVFDRNTWFIGTADGRLYFTVNQGRTWTQRTFPGHEAGQVRDIAFATPAVGYMAHDTAAPAGRVLRTIDGGNTWYVAPEGDLTIPANDRINALAICREDPNRVDAVGLADDGSDGIGVKFAA